MSKTLNYNNLSGLYHRTNKLDSSAIGQGVFITREGDVILCFMSGFYINGTCDHHEKVAEIICEENDLELLEFSSYKDLLIEKYGFIAISIINNDVYIEDRWNNFKNSGFGIIRSPYQLKPLQDYYFLNQENLSEYGKKTLLKYVEEF